MGQINSHNKKDKRIIIFKNDRGGDLLNSLKCISSLIERNSNITIFLSELNKSFSFLFKNVSIKKLKFNLTLLEKIKLLIFFFNNKIDEVYILTPKNYFFYLPFFFRKIKFHAIVIDGEKRDRPSTFLRKYLYKYEVVSRRRKINKTSLEQKQLNLIESKKSIQDFFDNLNFPKRNDFLDNVLPKRFYFFQFKKKFFEKIDWNVGKIDEFFNFLLLKVETVVFCSDIENSAYNKIFLNKYSNINFDNKDTNKLNKGNRILYLHNITGEDLFYVIKLSKKVICPHGIINEISKIYKISTLALFNFKIENKNDFLHQKISFSVWYPKKSFDFAFLNNNFKKALQKISTRI